MKLKLHKKLDVSAAVIPANDTEPAPKPKKQKKAFKAMPGEFAQCRAIAGGSLAAGVLLYRIAGLWRVRQNKLKRLNREWLANSRKDWGTMSGLSLSQVKNTALPELKKYCSDFLHVMQAKVQHDGPKLIWVSLDPDKLSEAMKEAKNNWEMEEISFDKK
ncbi:MAG: hypothetical protein JSR78_06550 [Proteobacteria bacterium]|nr:hypothetical protein [Pseudomonadota bacterium]